VSVGSAVSDDDNPVSLSGLVALMGLPGMKSLFDGVYVPSTGRSAVAGLHFGHARQWDAG